MLNSALFAMPHDPNCGIQGQINERVKLSTKSFPIGVTSTATVATAEVVTPSVAWYVKSSIPIKLFVGW